MLRQRVLRCALVRFVHARCGVASAKQSTRDQAVTVVEWGSCSADAVAAKLADAVIASRPLVVRKALPKALASESDWLTRIEELSGSRDVKVRLRPTAGSDEGVEGATFGDGTARAPYALGERRRLELVIEEIRASASSCGGAAVSCYAANISLSTALPEVADHLQPLSSRVKALHAELGALGPAVEGSPALYLGSGKQRTPLHFDPTENLTVVLQGTKSIRLFPPSASSLLGPVGGSPAAFACWLQGMVPSVYSGLDAWAPELAASRVQALDLELQAGDMLYLPVAWWHGVSGSTEPNVSLVFGFAPSTKKGARYYTSGLHPNLLKWVPTGLAIGAGYWLASPNALVTTGGKLAHEAKIKV